MNIIKKTFFAILCMALLPMRLWASDDYIYPWHHWQPEFSDFNMTATFAIRIDGVLQTSPDLEMGAFAGDICRSSFHLVESPFVPGLYISEGYNIQGYVGEVITFRLYDHSQERELDYVTGYCIPFEQNLHLGGADNPQYIDFFSSTSSYYTLVTDASQLVPGRSYLIANGCGNGAKFAGGQNGEEDERYAVDVTVANRKAYLEPAVNMTDLESVYQFELREVSGGFAIYDAVNQGYLNTTKKGVIKCSATQMVWQVEVDASGNAAVTTMISDKKKYLFYDGEDGSNSFYCTDDPSSLCLFAKCQLVEGTLSRLDINDPTQMYVVESGNVLDVETLTTVHPSNLIVEDGAQLITNSVTQITVQKNILAYADADERDGWYTLASPVAGEIESASNMTSNDFDLFYFLETVVTKEWRNYKNSENEFVNFESGRGYLYANSEDITLNFKGTLNTEAATYAMTYTDSRPDDLKGFALVGNPFAHNIKKGSGCAIDDARLATGYYTLTHSGAWETHTDDEMIVPGRGILIQTSEAGDLTINNVVASQTRGKSSHNAYLALEVEGKQGSDKAFVYFGEGIGLNKIAHFNNAPMLYLRQNAKDYAIAHYAADEMVGEVPVFFQASEIGKYAISVANEGLCFDYLHLVDNLTGNDVDLMGSEGDVPCRVSTYTFDAKTSDYASRFKLVYQLHHDIEDMAADFCYFADGRLVIPSIEGETTLQIIDLSGRIVSSQMVNGSYNQPLNLNAGVYVVRMGDKTQKIVVF
ncbi:MAG: T9SS type A sorting domain-containing protein [Bacteroidales bacterium]|nr:T9SS type A sorting domain-containing protein [Bacteroidales bacterium]